MVVVMVVGVVVVAVGVGVDCVDWTAAPRLFFFFLVLFLVCSKY